MENKIWGTLVAINLHDCNPKLIRNPKAIKNFVKQLCKKIKMKPHGKTIIDKFAEGHLNGYSFMQFIETSSITGHFDPIENRTFIDIFSCKKFDEKKAEDFCKAFFKAKSSKSNIFTRT